MCIVLFFFQAEDGIRDRNVTGVQTCALPILLTGAVLLGSATFVAAESNGNGFFNFEEMKPYIEEMHPNLSPEQQEEMFNNCHGENGMMQNNTGFRDMMNNI